MFDLLLDLISELFDQPDSLSDAGFNGHGNPDDLNIRGHRPTDIAGNTVGNDVWGRPNNTRLHD